MQDDLLKNLTELQGIAFCPLLNLERFAQLSGVEIGVLKNWVQRGYLPTRKVGRYRLVDVLAMLSGHAPAAAPSPRSVEARRAGRAAKTSPFTNRGGEKTASARAGVDK